MLLCDRINRAGRPLLEWIFSPVLQPPLLLITINVQVVFPQLNPRSHEQLLVATDRFQEFVIRGREKRSGRDDQTSLLLRDANANGRAAVELEKIIFDAVRKDGTTLGHQAFQDQLFLLLQQTDNEIGL